MVEEIGKDLCAFLNQESVTVVIDEIECYFISESLYRFYVAYLFS